MYIWYPLHAPTFPMYIQLWGALLLYEVPIGPISTWEDLASGGRSTATKY